MMFNGIGRSGDLARVLLLQLIRSWQAGDGKGDERYSFDQGSMSGYGVTRRDCKAADG